MSDTVTVTYSEFVEAFPEFADTLLYPQVTVTAYLERAQYYISNRNYGRLKDASRKYAIYLMTAHLLTIRDLLKDARSNGGQMGFTTHATIDNVSVTMEAPSSSNAFNEWLGLSGYGRELRALLAVKGSVPALVGNGYPYRVFQ